MINKIKLVLKKFFSGKLFIIFFIGKFIFSIIFFVVIYYYNKIRQKIDIYENDINNYKIREKIYEGKLKLYKNFSQPLDPSYLTISDIGLKILLEDLEGAKIIKSKVFYGSGGYLSIGPEYVLRNNDLYNQGVLNRCGIKIEKLLSKPFINYLKRKNICFSSKKLLQLSRENFNKWKNKNSVLHSISKDKTLKIFKSLIEIDLSLLKKLIKVKLYQWQFDAIIMSAYNLGLTNLKKAGFFDYINKNEFEKGSKVLFTVRKYILQKYYPQFFNSDQKFQKNILYEFINTSENFKTIFKDKFKLLGNELLNIKSQKLENIIKKHKSEHLPLGCLIGSKCLSHKSKLCNNLLSTPIYKDEILYALQIKNNENWKNQIKKLYTQTKFTKLKSIWNFIKKFFSITYCQIFKKDFYKWDLESISIKNLLEVISKRKKFGYYMQGWLKRDLIQTSLFMKELITSSHRLVVNHIISSSFYKILSEEKLKQWINEDMSSKNIHSFKNLYNRYFNLLEKEFNIAG